MREQIKRILAEIVGDANVLNTRGEVAPYLYDQTVPFLRPKANEDSIVVKPANTKEVSEIMKLANDEKVSVVVRGGGTGLCGAAIPVVPSIIISMERFKKIIEVDEKNFIITLESGVTLREIQEYLGRNSSMA